MRLLQTMHIKRPRISTILVQIMVTKIHALIKLLDKEYMYLIGPCSAGPDFRSSLIRVFIRARQEKYSKPGEWVPALTDKLSK